MPSLVETLEARWRTLWERLGARGDPKSVFDQLVWLYTDPHRKYHTLDHIAHCFAELDGVPEDQQLPKWDWLPSWTRDGIEVALWFHDAIYIPGHPLSERYSTEFAVWAIDALQPNDTMCADGLFKRCVRARIIASAHQSDRRELQDPMTDQFLDIDLAILGRPEAEFDAYEEGIRFEYQRVPDDAFHAGRIAVLEGFLARERIYRTDYFYRKYETQARLNLARSIALLREPYERAYR